MNVNEAGVKSFPSFHISRISVTPVSLLNLQSGKPLGFSDPFQDLVFASRFSLTLHHIACLTRDFLSSSSRASLMAQLNPCSSAAVRDEGKYDIGILRRQNEMLSLRSQG